MTRLCERFAGVNALLGVLLLLAGLLAVPRQVAAATAVDLVAVGDCTGACDAEVNDKKTGCVVTNAGCKGDKSPTCGCKTTEQRSEDGTEVVSCDSSCKPSKSIVEA